MLPTDARRAPLGWFWAASLTKGLPLTAGLPQTAQSHALSEHAVTGAERDRGACSRPRGAKAWLW